MTKENLSGTRIGYLNNNLLNSFVNPRKENPLVPANCSNASSPQTSCNPNATSAMSALFLSKKPSVCNASPRVACNLDSSCARRHQSTILGWISKSPRRYRNRRRQYHRLSRLTHFPGADRRETNQNLTVVSSGFSAVLEKNAFRLVAAKRVRRGAPNTFLPIHD